MICLILFMNNFLFLNR